jgi:hypothetical protein
MVAVEKESESEGVAMQAKFSIKGRLLDETVGVSPVRETFVVYLDAERWSWQWSGLAEMLILSWRAINLLSVVTTMEAFMVGSLWWGAR